jgi:predicted AlkP superfamily phosphohydrolase/phosphomutase
LSIKDKAAAVRRLINDEIVQEVLQEIREEQVNVFLSTATFPEDRESAHDIIVALNKIEDKFQGILAAEAITINVKRRGHQHRGID